MKVSNTLLKTLLVNNNTISKIKLFELVSHNFLIQKKHGKISAKIFQKKSRGVYYSSQPINTILSFYKKSIFNYVFEK